MPFTYDFVCGSCAAVFEAKAGPDERQRACIACGQRANRQFTVIDPARIRLFSERLHVTRSQVVAPHVRENWRGADLP